MTTYISADNEQAQPRARLNANTIYGGLAFDLIKDYLCGYLSAWNPVRTDPIFISLYLGFIISFEFLFIANIPYLNRLLGLENNNLSNTVSDAEVELFECEETIDLESASISKYKLKNVQNGFSLDACIETGFIHKLDQLLEKNKYFRYVFIFMGFLISWCFATLMTYYISLYREGKST